MAIAASSLTSLRPVAAGDKIRLAGVGKRFSVRGNTFQALTPVSLEIKPKEFVALVGPSGCGKSTILNMVAGLMQPSDGTVYYDGVPVTGPNRKVGYMTQKDTLLPWYSVRQNVALGLRFRHAAKDEIDRKIERLLHLAHLSNFADAYPHQLSGGMRRRVALCMSLAVDPQILLLDEPFGALDTHTKTHLHSELLEIWRELGQTIVMITHDLDEAITLANRVIVLSSPPSRVLLDERIDISYPRDVYELRQTKAFAEYVQRIWGVLGQQFKAVA